MRDGICHRNQINHISSAVLPRAPSYPIVMAVRMLKGEKKMFFFVSFSNSLNKFIATRLFASATRLFASEQKLIDQGTVYD